MEGRLGKGIEEEGGRLVFWTFIRPWFEFT